MKKMIAMAAVAMTMMMASCSGDDSESTDNPSENGPLLTKLIETYDGDTYTTNFHYNGNKLTDYTTNYGFEAEFTYSGDKLIKIEGYSDGELVTESNFEYYPDGKLAKHIELEYYDSEWIGTKTLFTHNNNGTVAFEFFTGDENAQTDHSYDGVITIVDGNITSVATESEFGSGWEHIYTYDNKHNPYKNVASFETLMFGDLQGGVNNILTEVDEEWGDDMARTYTYNSEGYPVTSSHTWDGEPDGEYEYFYE